MAPRKKKADPLCWRSSEGRKLLQQDLRDGTIPPTMDYLTAFQQRPEFDVGQTFEDAVRLFQGRLARTQKCLHDRQSRSASELALLQQDLASLPPPDAVDHWGNPRWEGSVAQSLLKQDVANNQHVTLTREQFYLSRTEYGVYTKKYISKKIEQEVALQKFLKQYRDRRNGF